MTANSIVRAAGLGVLALVTSAAIAGAAEIKVISTIGAKAKEAEAAKAFIKFLSGPPAGAVYKAKGLDPA